MSARTTSPSDADDRGQVLGASEHSPDNDRTDESVRIDVHDITGTPEILRRGAERKARPSETVHPVRDMRVPRSTMPGGGLEQLALLRRVCTRLGAVNSALDEEIDGRKQLLDAVQRYEDVMDKAMDHVNDIAHREEAMREHFENSEDGMSWAPMKSVSGRDTPSPSGIESAADTDMDTEEEGASDSEDGEDDFILAGL